MSHFNKNWNGLTISTGIPQLQISLRSQRYSYYTLC